MKRVVLTVTNDIFSDQRLARTAGTLHKNGYSVFVIGRRLAFSPPVHRPYPVKRYRLLFQTSFLFYANYNIVLFFDLLFRRYDIAIANDLDTLPGCHLASWLRRKKVVFDSHELFPEVPELTHRPFVRKVWLFLERCFVPRQKKCITVCDAIAEHYKNKYGTAFTVVRNVPEREDYDTDFSDVPILKQPLLIYQGALNKGRGIEKMIMAMKFLTGYRLLIAGTGDIEKDLKHLTNNEGVSDKVIFTGRLSPVTLQAYTRQARLGLSLEENLGLNYYYALPNKLFDYIHANIPVLVSDFPEMKRIVDTYKTGRCTTENDPEKLAEIIRSMMDSNDYATWKQNTERASSELCWENESHKLMQVIDTL